jgi:GMP synthase (glutamine-hydrolysing)
MAGRSVLPTLVLPRAWRSPDTVEIVRVFKGEALPVPDASHAAVITGPWAMMTD